MTKKDYIEVASIIRSYKDYDQPLNKNTLLELITEALAKKFEADNPRFDYSKFRKACGFEG